MKQKILQNFFLALVAMIVCPIVGLRAQEITDVELELEVTINGKVHKQTYTTGDVYVTYIPETESGGTYHSKLTLRVKGNNLDQCTNHYIYIPRIGAWAMNDPYEWENKDSNKQELVFKQTMIKINFGSATVDNPMEVMYSNNGNSLDVYESTGLRVIYHTHATSEESVAYTDTGDPYAHAVAKSCKDCPVLGGYSTNTNQTEKHEFANGACIKCHYTCQHPENVTANPSYSNISHSHASNSKESGSNLFDNNPDTKWCGNFEGAYVQFQIKNDNSTYARRILSYTLTTAMDAKENAHRNWKAWTIWGSDTGSNWEIVDRVEYAELPTENNAVSEVYHVDAPKAYAHYKITVDAIRGSESFTATTQQMGNISFVFDEYADDNGCTLCDVQYANHTPVEGKTHEFGTTYDVSQLFTKDTRVGDATYQVIPGGSGAGTIDGNVLTITRAGTIRVMMTTEASGIYLASRAIAKLTVSKISPTKSPGFVAPIAREGLVYNQNIQQELVNPGVLREDAGTRYYVLSTSNETAPTEGWSTDIPTASIPGTYYVWYKIVGNESYTDIAPVCLTCTLGKHQVVKSVYDCAITYGEEPRNNGCQKGYTSDDFNDDSDLERVYSYMIKNELTYRYTYNQYDDVGEYEIQVYLEGNYYDVLSKYSDITFTPDKLTVEPKQIVEKADYTYTSTFTYDGQPLLVEDIVAPVYPERFVAGEDYTYSFLRNGEETTDLTNAGTILLQITGQGNYKGTNEHQIEIQKADPTYLYLPIARTDLVFKNEYQSLLSTIATTRIEGTTVLYSFDGEKWSHIPPYAMGDVNQATTYTIYYKIQGNENYNDTEPDSIQVTIGVCPHRGGTATCTELAICSNCGFRYGEVNPDLHDYAETDGICTRCHKVNPEATSVTIVDASYTGGTCEAHETIVVAEKQHNKTVNYKRQLPNLTWNPLFVPFEIEINKEILANYDVAYINDVHSYDENEDGVIEQMSMEIIQIKSGTLHANHPYIIRAKSESAREMDLVFKDVTLCSTAEEAQTDITCSSAYIKFTVKGTYTKLKATDIPGARAVGADGSWVKLYDDAILNPFRLYLETEILDGAPVKNTMVIESAVVTIRLRGESGGATGIELIEQQVQPVGTIFDLMGRPVKNPIKGQIYIENGKKRVY